MEVKTFRDDEHYVQVQKRTERKRRHRPFTLPGELEYVARHFLTASHLLDEHLTHTSRHIRAMCHGARLGLEIDSLKKNLNDLRRITSAALSFQVMGTDLVDHGHADIHIHDFRKERTGWLKSFDLIYSNSLDHSDQPLETLRTWTKQLKIDGIMYIQWSKWHTKTGRGDCFAAALHEYVELLECCNLTIKEVKYLNPQGYCIAAQRTSHGTVYGSTESVYSIQHTPGAERTDNERFPEDTDQAQSLEQATAAEGATHETSG